MEEHPWEYYIPKEAHTLIIGTFPPVKKKWSFDFFYPNKQNLFWKVMSRISGKELAIAGTIDDVSTRKEVLDLLQAGVTDMGRKIYRSHESSLDENIEAIEYTDIIQLVNNHPGINKLIFTSSNGKTSAARWFKNYLSEQGIIFSWPVEKKPIRTHLLLQDKTYELVVLYSPSSRAANRISFDALSELYRKELIP